MFDHEPTPEDIAEWFSRHQLHPKMEHKDWISGLVAIENTQSGKSFWTVYPKAAARIAYFHRWCEVNAYDSVIEVLPPETFVIQHPLDSGKAWPAMFVKAKVSTHGTNPTRVAHGTKQIRPLASQWHPTERGVKVLLPDPAAMMKGETGAIARALGNLGMLTFADSGIATAEDMVEYMAVAEAEKQPVADKPRVETRRAANPKK